MSELHVLNLGAGVQSTALYLMFMHGLIEPPIEVAIFADTQEEPSGVYRHLEWLKSLGGPPILCRTRGKLGDDLEHGTNSTGQRFASIPCFTAGGSVTEYDYDDNDELTAGSGRTVPGGVGRTRRQCSKEYKTTVIERTIRRELLGLLPRARVPKSVKVFQYLGISLDEAGRARRIKDRFAATIKWARPQFPLLDQFWTRGDCLKYLAGKVPHQTPRSACVFCPYHSDPEWVWLRDNEPDGWKRAVYLDHAMRQPGWIGNRLLNRPMYLHRSCRPLDEVVFNTQPRPRDLQLSISFAAVCEGVCGV